MCIANIALEQGIANGTQGIVEDFVGVDNAPLIRFNNGMVKTLLDIVGNQKIILRLALNNIQ